MHSNEEYVAKFSGKTIAVAVHDLATGESININADESFHPASTMKVPVMMEVFRESHEGLFSLRDGIEIFNSFTSIADGSKYSLDVNDDSETSLYARIGESESIQELTRLMIVRSSNLATNILIEKVGAKSVNTYLKELGIQGVEVVRGIEDNAAFRLGMNNSATARGLTLMMRLIAEGKVVSKEASKQMIQIMLGQEFNESIPALLPGTARVAHKTGWTGEFYHDTGIVFPEARAPYAISILTRGFAENQAAEAHDCMANLSKLIYDQITGK
ncbi:MAG TPA: serine hydrolase [Anaerolineales bacterium]|nr:serine hydrolase [Anaerolineales bacterium]